MPCSRTCRPDGCQLDWRRTSGEGPPNNRQEQIGRTSLHDAEGKMRHPSALDHTRALQVDRPGAEVVEQADAAPSRTGTRSMWISSRSPARMHCCTMLAAPTPTSLSPATACACSRALTSPSVTNLNGDPSSTHSGGTELLTTKTGTSKGCLPPHPWVRSNVLRPNTNAPVVSRVSRRNSAVCGETLKTMSVPGSRYSVSPAPYQAKSRSPPTPMGASGPSFGPLINPSSETASPVRTFPMFVLLSLVGAKLANPTRVSSEVSGLEGRGPDRCRERYAR